MPCAVMSFIASILSSPPLKRANAFIYVPFLKNNFVSINKFDFFADMKFVIVSNNFKITFIFGGLL
ncbi:hypothetical protein C3H34_04345 [Campylobacter jejuni]|nr:hypothetical protein C3H34_04345 [Campylobacter jejuni]